MTAGSQTCRFNPVSQVDSLSDTGCFTLEWDWNDSWSKTYNRHSVCSMKGLQEMFTDLLIQFKINWTLRGFFLEWNQNPPDSFSRWVFFVHVTKSSNYFILWIICSLLLKNPPAVSSSTACPNPFQFSLKWCFQTLLSSRKDAAVEIKHLVIFGIGDTKLHPKKHVFTLTGMKSQYLKRERKQVATGEGKASSWYLHEKPWCWRPPAQPSTLSKYVVVFGQNFWSA